ncbi:Kallikrein-12 [Heterocephalus glaber]|uniref:Kallikrein-12 n=1 Tax=Heterocephalus glaber TaxID=10181 RepID=G5BR95_HETGA|nr:Kallikrein-12 [Heterocephalus glaber]
MGLGTFLLLCALGLSRADREKIFHGVECVPHSQPWQVGLFSGSSLHCGGVLIHPRYWVRLGEHSLGRLDWTEQFQRSGLSVTHLGYQGALQSHPFPDRHQCLNPSAVSTDACQAAFPGRITANTVCAGGVAGKDGCRRDSGGLLVCGGVLQGLVSWGSVGPCGQKGIPGVYTFVCKYVDWIRMIMRNN